MNELADFEITALENKTPEEIHALLDRAYMVLGTAKTHSLQRVKALISVKQLTQALAVMTYRQAYRFRRELII